MPGSREGAARPRRLSEIDGDGGWMAYASRGLPFVRSSPWERTAGFGDIVWRAIGYGRALLCACSRRLRACAELSAISERVPTSPFGLPVSKQLRAIAQCGESGRARREQAQRVLWEGKTEARSFGREFSFQITWQLEDQAHAYFPLTAIVAETDDGLSANGISHMAFMLP